MSSWITTYIVYSKHLFIDEWLKTNEKRVSGPKFEWFKTDAGKQQIGGKWLDIQE